jgi:PKD repeat protein
MKKFLTFYFFLFIFQTSYSQIYTSIQSNLQVCAGASFKIKYQAYGSYTTGNVFTAQLSSNTGNFNSPINIGSLTSTAFSDSISVTIPSNAVTGTSYYIRVVSSTPSSTGYNSSSFTIGVPPYPGFIIYNSPLCVGNTLRLNVNGTYTGNLVWSGPNGFSSTSKTPSISNITTNESGVYNVKVQWLGGCTSTASSTTININSTIAPPKATISGNSPICTYDTIKLVASTIPNVTYQWLNPYGTVFSTVQNPNVTVYDPSATYSSGKFAVRTVSGSCYSDTSTYNVLIRNIPSINNFLVNDNIDLICPGSNIVLSVDNDGNGTNYQWTGTNGFTATGNYITYNNVTSSGKYSLKATGTNGCVSTAVGNYVMVDNTTPISYQTGSWEWARAIVNKSGVGVVREIQRDKVGNVYVSMDLNPSTYAKFTAKDSIVSYGNYDIVVAKYDSLGTFQWARQMGSNNADYSGGMAVDENGNMFVAGAFTGITASFGSYNLNRSGPSYNFFLTKLDNAGNFLWVKQGIDSTSGVIYGISSPLAVDKNGNCYFLSGSSKKLYIEGQVIQNSNFLGKFSSAGELKWVSLLQNANPGFGYSRLSLDNNSNTYIIGANGMNPSLVKIDSSGNILYSKIYTSLRPGGNINNNYIFGGSDIAIGKDGNVYTAIPFYIKTKPSTLVVANPPCFIVLFKADKDGNELWHQYINEYDSNIRIGLDGFNNLYVTGNLDQNYACTPISLISNRAGYISKYNTFGQLQWVKPIAASSSSTYVGCSPLYVTALGDIFYGGEYYANQVFGDTLKGNYSSVNWMIGKIARTAHEINNTSAQYCLGQSFSLSYSINRQYTAGNIFQVQLSDKNGKFNNPVVIGSINSTTSGNIPCVIPMDAQVGSKYRIRIISTNPGITSIDNGFDISIITPIITTGNISSTTICAGSAVKVPFITSGTCSFYSGNKFKVQLSDKDGNFTTPIDIGTKPGLVSDSILVTIPDTIPYSDKYKFRVVGTLPAVAGIPSASSITIYGEPQITTLGTTYCVGTNISLTATSITGATYQWTGPNGFTSPLSNPVITSISYSSQGIYKVKAKIGACQTKESQIYIPLFKTQPKDSAAWRWAKRIGINSSSYRNQPNDIQVDKKYNVYISGYTYTSIDTIFGTVIPNGYYLIKSDTSGNVHWVKSIGQTSSTNVNSFMAIDTSSENIYIGGFFTNKLTYDKGTITSSGAGDRFLVKVLPDGTIDWAKQVSTLASYRSNFPGNIVIDKSGNPIICGASNPVSNNGKNIMFVTKYSPSGQILTTREFNSTFTGSVQVALDKDENIYVAGDFIKSIALDSVGLDSIRLYGFGTGTTNVFLAKYNPSFHLVWVRRLGGSEKEGFRGVKLDGDGNAYIATEHNSSYSTPTFFSTNFNSIGYQKPNYDFISKYDSYGNYQWTRELSASISDFDTDLNGNTYISTYTLAGPSTEIGCSMIPSVGNSRVYIIKYTKDGNVSYIKDAHSSGTGILLYGITVSPSGNVFATGSGGLTNYFDNNQLVTNKGYFARLDLIDSLPTTSFTYSQTCYPDTIQFSNSSSFHFGSLQSCVWEFGDPSSGTSNSSTLLNPKHKFSSLGTYTVTLTVTSTYGKQKSLQKVISIKEKPVITINTPNIGLCEGSAIEFTASSTNFPSSTILWNWDLEDPLSGSSNTSVASDVWHTFSQAGTYSVRVKGEKDGCIDSTSKVITINPVPSMDFNWDNICSSKITNFSTQTSDNIVSWKWDFADPSSSENYSYVADPSHQFSTAQTYPVKVVFKNNVGCKDSLTNNVTIYQSPQIDFSIQNLCIPSTTNFINSSLVPNIIMNQSWTINPGDIVLPVNSNSYSFQTQGTYSIKLKIEDTQGCIDSLTKNVDIYTPDKPLINQSSDSLSTGEFASYKWFKDNEELVGLVGNKIKTVGNGNYTVTIVDNHGCMASSDSYKYAVEGIDIGISSSVFIFPNPTKDLAYIKYITSTSNKIEVELIDAYGQSLIKENKNCNYGENLIELYLNYIPSGIYYLSIKNDSQKNVTKLIIQK